MPNAFHHAIDLVFMIGIAMLGRSIKNNAELIPRSVFGFLTNEFGRKVEFTAESASRLGSACFIGGVLAGIAYLAIIPADLMLAK